jgi:CubicO group peptidase (beta-lactamase class C family)
VLATLLLSTACAPSATRPAPEAGDAAQLAWRQRVVGDSVRAVLARGLADSAYPAAWAVVGSARHIFVSAGVGSITDAPALTPVSDSTVWDLASLTKVIGTTSAILQLVDAGLVQLDAPATRYLPRWRAPGAERITVRHLLSHSAGLPAWRPLYKESWSAEEAIAQVYATGPDTTPGTRYVYSDLGFILLGELVREVSGLPLDSYLLARVFLPAGMTETRFHPPQLWRSRTAPTEIDPWRQRHLRAEVHDENAWQLGAVAGHAGLFSTARDLTRFAQLLLRGGVVSEPNGSASSVFGRATLAAFQTRQSLGGAHRALGWETPTGDNSGGRRLSAQAFGHTGFTGTSLWVDPARDVFVLLLTNRVNPTRQRFGIGSVRPALADAVVGALEATTPRTAAASPRQSGRTRRGADNLE